METDRLLNEAGKALRKAALNEEAKAHVLGDKMLFQLVRKAAERYIAGESLVDVQRAVSATNSQGVSCTVDYMGESIRTEQQANDVTEEFLELARLIKGQQLDCTISLDLSHVGLAVDSELGLENLRRICGEGLEVIISAEGVDRTDRVLETYMEAAKMHNNVGITLQAYLHRSEGDVRELMKRTGKIRIVKGAFDTPHGVALERGEALDSRYLNLVQILLDADHPCSIATHDERIQSAVIDRLGQFESQRNYEFESLLGIENDRIFGLSRQHPTRLYIVYGLEWYLYLCNRLAEHPFSVFQAIVDIVHQK